MLSPQVLATIQIVLPPERRAAAFAAQGAVLSLATFIGPLFAGLLSSGNILGLSWRPIFLVNVPVRAGGDLARPALPAHAAQPRRPKASTSRYVPGRRSRWSR